MAADVVFILKASRSNERMVDVGLYFNGNMLLLLLLL